MDVCVVLVVAVNGSGYGLLHGVVGCCVEFVWWVVGWRRLGRGGATVVCCVDVVWWVVVVVEVVWLWAAAWVVGGVLWCWRWWLW